jgi:hypothetical protein
LIPGDKAWNTCKQDVAGIGPPLAMTLLPKQADKGGHRAVAIAADVRRRAPVPRRA